MTSHLDSVIDLEAQFAEAMQRLYSVGNSLDRLRQEIQREQSPTPDRTAPRPEKATGPTPGPMPGPTPAPQPEQTPPLRPQRASSAGARPGIPPLQAPTALPWWQQEGAVAPVLGMVGAAVTLIGLVMLLVIAIQRGLFGPVPRMVSGAVLAVGLVVFAHRVRRRQQNSGALALAATGYAAAYLDIVAMTTIYHYLPVWAGLALAAAAAASGLLIARAWNSELLGVLTVLGVAILAPVLGGLLTSVTAAFLVVLAAAAFPAQLGRDWSALELVRMVPASGILLLDLGFATEFKAPAAELTVMAVALAGLGLVSSSWLVSRTPSDVVASAVVAVSALPLLALPQTYEDPWAALTALATAAAYLIGWFALCVLERGALPLHLRATAASVAAVAVIQAVVEGAPADYLGTGLLVVALGYLGMSLVGQSGTAAVIGLAAGGIALVAYTRVIPPMLGVEPHGALTVATLVDSLLAMAVLVAMARVLREVGAVPESRHPVATTALWVGSLLASSGAVVSAGVLAGRGLDAAGRGLDAEQGGFMAGHATATLLWMAGAAYLLMHGLKRVADARVALRAGLVLAGVAVGKLMLFDFSALEGMGRVLAFIGSGMLLLAMGTGYARALDRARHARPV